jgi:hypothetical protein
MVKGELPVAFETETTEPPETGMSEVDELLAQMGGGSDYADQVVELYEASERNYRAAMMAGHVVNGFTDSTNY